VESKVTFFRLTNEVGRPCGSAIWEALYLSRPLQPLGRVVGVLFVCDSRSRTLRERDDFVEGHAVYLRPDRVGPYTGRRSQGAYSHLFRRADKENGDIELSCLVGGQMASQRLPGAVERVFRRAVDSIFRERVGSAATEC
jgi:hypothetical protein